MHIDDIAIEVVLLEVNVLAWFCWDQYRGVKCIANYVLDLEGSFTELAE